MLYNLSSKLTFFYQYNRRLVLDFFFLQIPQQYLWGEDFDKSKSCWFFSKVGHPRNPNFDFRGYISIFLAENTTKKRPSKAKNNAYTTSEQVQNNFQKAQKAGFLTLKIDKITLSEGQILT